MVYAVLTKVVGFLRLQVDYENVRRRAQEIGDVIQRLNAQKLKLRNTSNNLHNAWQGEAADIFKAKLDELINELDSAIREMSTIKNTILSVAESIRKTDEGIANEVARGSITGIRYAVAGRGSEGGG